MNEFACYLKLYGWENFISVNHYSPLNLGYSKWRQKYTAMEEVLRNDNHPHGQTE